MGRPAYYRTDKEGSKIILSSKYKDTIHHYYYLMHATNDRVFFNYYTSLYKAFSACRRINHGDNVVLGKRQFRVVYTNDPTISAVSNDVSDDIPVSNYHVEVKYGHYSAKLDTKDFDTAVQEALQASRKYRMSVKLLRITFQPFYMYDIRTKTFINKIEDLDNEYKRRTASWHYHDDNRRY